ncbi:glucose 1-dehydrogenase [bacterium]|jgi:3alpha(or 20beta)-hydroxysteroid dehydrogenase|nr:glucose 1-dehydrogenase [Acidimicrobiaceae bacterium]MDA9360059.1 glucose 1-dehydrogenase [bacterium]MDB4103581.1 glucose 1-dehydrogenase [Acidimicrobiales bacterium]MBT6445937.1 glucose 1-dehydrogenase [Acidimicrobiaceae bacterium]MDG1087326.1 glucose 1-dehydrogenase [Acidimicrobiales bacterium]
MGRLDGKVALITGGARGMGAEDSRLFAAEGAVVVLTDVLDDLGAETASQIDGASYHHLDIRNEAEWQAVVDQVMSDHGRIDVLVNNAGVDLVKKLLATTIEDFEQVTDINLRGTFLGMRTVAEAMIKAELPCSIVNISSVAGLQGLANHAVYSASKFGVTGLTKSAAKEWGRYGIRVNSVHPGLIETAMTADMRSFTDPEVRRQVERTVPLRRMGKASDIAKLALFLASDDSDYCSGQAYIVDGGVHP